MNEAREMISHATRKFKVLVSNETVVPRCWGSETEIWN